MNNELSPTPAESKKALITERKSKKALFIGLWVLIVAIIAGTVVYFITDINSKWKEIDEAQDMMILTTKLAIPDLEEKHPTREYQLRYIKDLLFPFFTYQQEHNYYLQNAVEEQKKAAASSREATEKMLRTLGFHRGAEYYLKFYDKSEFVDNCWSIENTKAYDIPPLQIILVEIGLMAVLLAFNIIYSKDKRFIALGEGYVELGKRSGAQTKVHPGDLTGIESNGKGALTVRGNNVNYRITRVINADEIKSEIDGMILGAKTSAPETAQGRPSAAEELKQYKDLLDNGVITEEEFDAKKKQLLGL